MRMLSIIHTYIHTCTVHAGVACVFGWCVSVGRSRRVFILRLSTVNSFLLACCPHYTDPSTKMVTARSQMPSNIAITGYCGTAKDQRIQLDRYARYIR